jgi:hypothetical protein
METININGKEYTENEFTRKCKKHKILLDGSLSMIFDELKEKFPRQQPEPPTLRPMSELLEFERVNIKVARFNAPEGSFWIIGMKRINHKGGTSIESSHCCFVEEKEVFVNYSHGAKAEGWLPLPNPDEIKLP